MDRSDSAQRETKPGLNRSGDLDLGLFLGWWIAQLRGSSARGNSGCWAVGGAAVLSGLVVSGGLLVLRSRCVAQEDPLKSIAATFASVVQTLEEAKLRTGNEAAVNGLRRARGRFESQVETPLEKLIAERNGAVEAAGGGAAAALLQARDEAELTRVSVLLVYSRALSFAEGESTRKKALEAGDSLAKAFVSDRFTFPVMQFRAQLLIGLFAFEQGDFSDAASELEVLYSPPPFEKPSPSLVGAFRNLRLEALLYGTRALNAGQGYVNAVEAVETHFLQKTEGPFDVSNAESDKALRGFAVGLRLEYAVALAGTGQPDRAFSVIDSTIEKYASAGPDGEGFVTDARQALSRMAAIDGVTLRGRDLLEAALGLKSQRRWDEALAVLQQALQQIVPRDLARVAPRCLNEIGEISFLLERYSESALAYREICAYFPQSELIRKAAQNFLAAATKALSAEASGKRKHRGLVALRDEAAKIYDQHGGGLGGFEAVMAEAGQLEARRRYKEARELYLQVPRQHGGVNVPFYWRAQASAWTVVYLDWERAEEETRAQFKAELDKAVEALGGIVAQGLRDGDRSGAALAALTRGRIHYDRQEWQPAVAALEVFAGELRGTSYECSGLGYLALAHMGAGDCATAAGLIKEFKACKQDPILSYVAFQLSDCFHQSGDTSNAARFASLYQLLPSSAPDFEKLDTVLFVAERLLDGGEKFVGGARDLVEKARTLGASEPDLERQLLYLQGKLSAGETRWDEAIASFQKYEEKFGLDGEDHEDPYVLRDLGRCYRKRRKRTSTADAQKAANYFGRACYVFTPRRADATVEVDYWRSAYEWMLMTSLLCRQGSREACGDVITFVAERKHKEMGSLKDKFLALERRARKEAGLVDGD
jgi:tetratricopeptide (TPR) repeat protein